MADKKKPSSANNLREANVESKATRKFWIWTLIIATVMALFAIGVYLYLTREKPIQTLNVAAGPYRSDSYELMKEIADVVSRQSEVLRIGIIPTTDSSQNIALLNQGKKIVDTNDPNHASLNKISDNNISVDLATIRSDTPVGSTVRMVSQLFPDYFQIITKHNSNIRTFNDLVGKKIALPRFGTDELKSFWALADHYDVAINSLNWESMEFDYATKKLLAGEIDALFTVRSLRDRLVLNLYEDAALKKQELKLVEIELAPAIALKRPFIQSELIPKGAYSGNPVIPKRDTATLSVSRNLVVREDVDTELIADLTSILFENRMDLLIRFALASAIKRPDLVGGTQVPLHEGADQYYSKDEPSFLQENAEPIALMITIAAGLFSGLLALRSRFMSGQKDRMDSYNYMLLDISDKARNSSSSAELKALKNEHYSILERVVRALDTDEVTEEGFQSFSLLWESVREVLNERTKDLS